MGVLLVVLAGAALLAPALSPREQRVAAPVEVPRPGRWTTARAVPERDGPPVPGGTDGPSRCPAAVGRLAGQGVWKVTASRSKEFSFGAVKTR